MQHEFNYLHWINMLKNSLQHITFWTNFKSSNSFSREYEVIYDTNVSVKEIAKRMFDI